MRSFYTLLVCLVVVVLCVCGPAEALTKKHHHRGLVRTRAKARVRNEFPGAEVAKAMQAVLKANVEVSGSEVKVSFYDHDGKSVGESTDLSKATAPSTTVVTRVSVAVLDSKTYDDGVKFAKAHPKVIVMLFANSKVDGFELPLPAPGFHLGVKIKTHKPHNPQTIDVDEAQKLFPENAEFVADMKKTDSFLETQSETGVTAKAPWALDAQHQPLQFPLAKDTLVYYYDNTNFPGLHISVVYKAGSTQITDWDLSETHVTWRPGGPFSAKYNRNKVAPCHYSFFVQDEPHWSQDKNNKRKPPPPDEVAAIEAAMIRAYDDFIMNLPQELAAKFHP